MEKKYIYYGLGAALLYYLYTQYKNVNELLTSIIIEPVDVSIDWFHPLAPVIKGNINIINPTSKTVTITKLFVNAFYNDTSIGTVTVPDPIIIKGASTQRYELDLTVNSLQLATLLLKTKSLKNINLYAKGYFISSGIEFPIYLDFSPVDFYK